RGNILPCRRRRLRTGLSPVAPMKILLVAAILAATPLVASEARADEAATAKFVRELIESLPHAPETLAGKIEEFEIKPARDQTFEFDLKPNTEYHIYGACDRACSDLDMSARDENFNELDIDKEKDDAPVLAFRSGASRQLRLRVFMSGCDALVCTAGFGIYT